MFTKWQEMSFSRNVFRALRLLLFAACASLFATGALAIIPDTERAALIDLYNGTNGNGWTHNTNWKTDGNFSAPGTECTWRGVTCNTEQAHVTKIDLNFNNLDGSLPSTLNALTALDSFVASENQLVGAIPSLSGLTALQDFFVSDNQLTGDIPDLSELTALRTFNVDINHLDGPIPTLTGLAALQTFSASRNQLTGSIPSLTGMVTLKEFVADSNRLTGSIPPLTGLSSLEKLAVRNNQITGNIPDLVGLTTLKWFDVANNQLTGTIPSLIGLTAMTYFDVVNNQLTGSLPSLAGLAVLEWFGTANNQLTGVIPDLAGLTTLQWFDVSQNRLTGGIPSLAEQAALFVFVVNDNKLTGAPPVAPGNLFPGNSQLCPNYLDLSADSAVNAAWNTATGEADWHAKCTAAPAIVVVSGVVVFDPTVSGGTLPQLTLACTPEATAGTTNTWTAEEDASCTLGTTGGTPPTDYSFDGVTFGPSDVVDPATGAFIVPSGGITDLTATVALKANPPHPAASPIPTLDPKALLMLAMFVLLIGGVVIGGTGYGQRKR